MEKSEAEISFQGLGREVLAFQFSRRGKPAQRPHAQVTSDEGGSRGEGPGLLLLSHFRALSWSHPYSSCLGVTVLEGKFTRKVEAKVRGLLTRTRGSESGDWRGTSFNCFLGDTDATYIYLALSSQGA